MAGSVVISAAQWRICPDELWDPGAPALARLRSLIRLRDRRGLPRWVFAARWPAAKGLPCDLESLRALSVLEEAGSGPGGLLLEEILPKPGELAVTDHGGGAGDPVASELMIRLAVPVQAAASRPSHRDMAGGGETNGGQEAHG